MSVFESVLSSALCRRADSAAAPPHERPPGDGTCRRARPASQRGGSCRGRPGHGFRKGSAYRMKTRHRARQLAPAPVWVRKTVPAGITPSASPVVPHGIDVRPEHPEIPLRFLRGVFLPRPLFRNWSPGEGGTCFGCVPSPDESRKRRKYRSLGAKIFRDDPFVGRSNITELSFVLQDICHFRLRFSDVARLFFARRAFGRFRGPVFCSGFAAEIPLPAIFPLSVVFSPPTFPTSPTPETKNALLAAELRTPSEAIPCRAFCAGCVCDAGSDGVPCRKSVVFVLSLRKSFSSRMTSDRAPAGRVWRTVRNLSPVAVAETAVPEHVPVSASAAASASTGTGSREPGKRVSSSGCRTSRKKNEPPHFRRGSFRTIRSSGFRVTTTE